MNVNLKDLIAALPQEQSEASESEITQDQLAQIFADLAQRPVPVSSLHRLWSVGELSAQIAFAYGIYWIRQWFAEAEERKRELLETNLRVALKMIHRFGYLRGAATKMGQALANLPSIIPDQMLEALDRLHWDAPPMHFSLLREMLCDELGEDPENIFDSFEKDAFAAASIGQVHRARLKSGEHVAIKIQYPGIARTIDADFRNLGALLFPARMGKDWEYTKSQFDEIHRMLKLEADYLQEAQNLQRAQALFHPEDGIVVPRVYEKYCTQRVLTMEFLPGLHLRDFLATNPIQTVRNAFGTKIYRTWARMYNAGFNYADPHSGNYLFMDDGTLGLLDFGCIQQFDAEERAVLRLSEELFNGLDKLPEVLQRCGVPEEELGNEEFMGLMRESTNWIMEPLKVSGAFDFGDEDHFKRGVDIFSRIVLKRHTRSHPMWIYWNRALYGIRALMYQLRAHVDVNAVLASERLLPLK
jgi:predicted unusual protein kinase regulating ubiquinone biosynthesis (AarF/ABC1/UbiB family)